MTLNDYAQAYIAVQGLMQERMSYASASALLTLRRHLEPQAMYFAGEERKLADEFAAHDAKGGIIWTGPGSFNFAAPERATEYAARRAQHMAAEVQEQAPALRIAAPESITPAQLEALAPFVEFTEAGK